MGDTVTETRFTPGPWKFVKWDEKGLQALMYMDCNCPEDEPNNWRWAGWMSTRTDANARLIASAPDLYKALERIIDSVSRGPSGDVCQTYDFDDARDALAKARGETP